MARPTFPTQATAARYLKAALAAGAKPTELRIEPDGTLRVLLGDGVSGQAQVGGNPWDAALE